MIELIEKLRHLANKLRQNPEYQEAVIQAIVTIEHQKKELSMLAELLAKLETDKAAAIAQVTDAAAKELADLTAAGKVLSDADAATLKAGGSILNATDTAALIAELAKNGLDANGQPITPAPAPVPVAPGA